MVLSRLKARLQALFVFLAGPLIKLSIKPNVISFIGFVFALFSSLCYWLWSVNSLMPFFAVFFLLASGLCDAIDGAIARARGMATPFGGFLDSLLDRYADAFVLLGVVYGGLCGVLEGVLSIIGSLLVSYCRARAEVEGVKMESIGLAERAERMLLLALFSLLGIYRREFIRYGVALLAVLTHLTVIHRAFYVARRMAAFSAFSEPSSSPPQP